MITVGIILFDDVEELDFAGPWEVFGSAAALTGELRVLSLAEKPGPVRGAKGLRVIPDGTFAESPPLDVLLIPGGIGTRREVENPAMLEFVRRAAATARLVTSVCTGSLVLHGAGLVQGLRVTTHWAFTDTLEARGGVTVMRDTRWVRDGRVVTSAGVSAGIDMSLWIVGQLFDPTTARRVQRAIEYDPAPPYAAEV